MPGKRASFVVENRPGLFATPADARFHITDAAGTELEGGTCTPSERNMAVRETVTVTCDIPADAGRLTAFRRGAFGGEYLAAWDLSSQTAPDSPAAQAPDAEPVVVVDGTTVTSGTVDENGVWTASVAVTGTAPADNGAEATVTPTITVDGTPVDASSFRITTKAAAPAPQPQPNPDPNQPNPPAPDPDQPAPAPAPDQPTATTAPTVVAAAPKDDPGGLARTGTATGVLLVAALALTAAGALALARKRSTH